MKKLSKLFLSILFFSLFIGNTIFAVESTNSGITVLATVNIEEAKIVSQKGNIFNISFSLSNRTGVQAGVKYGVELFKETDKGQVLVDEKIYDESLTLNENTVIKKEITYTAPSFLDGSYNLILTSSNTSGFLFAITSIGKVELVATSQGVQILPETCYLQIIEEKNNPIYTLNQFIAIDKEENIKITCKALNSSKSDISVVPSYETRYLSIYGDTVSQTGGDTTPISFKTGENKTFSVVLPKATTPQLYNVNLTLNNKNIESNSINIRYVLRGVNAIIQNFSLDKNYYNDKDIAKLSLIWASLSNSDKITLVATINSDKQKECIIPINQILDKTGLIEISAPIISKCNNPEVIVTLKDINGNTLDQKQLLFKSETKSALNTQSMQNIILIILGILVVAGIALYFKNLKNKSNETINSNENNETNNK